MSATYTKLKTGAWGIRGVGLKVGPAVVTKRDGTTADVVVVKVLWTGPDGTSIAAIAGSDSGAASTSRGSSRRRGGSREYECEECGDRVVPGTRCWETGCIH